MGLSITDLGILLQHKNNCVVATIFQNKIHITVQGKWFYGIRTIHSLDDFMTLMVKYAHVIEALHRHIWLLVDCRCNAFFAHAQIPLPNILLLCGQYFTQFIPNIEKIWGITDELYWHTIPLVILEFLGAILGPWTFPKVCRELWMCLFLSIHCIENNQFSAWSSMKPDFTSGETSI